MDGGAVGKRLAKKAPPGQTLFSNILFSGASKGSSKFFSGAPMYSNLIEQVSKSHRNPSTWAQPSSLYKSQCFTGSFILLFPEIFSGPVLPSGPNVLSMVRRHSPNQAL